MMLAAFGPFSPTAWAQGITGKLTNNAGQPVAFANVLLLSQADSSFLAGATSDASGVFVIASDVTKALLKVSCIGYITHLQQCDTTNMGTIVLAEDSKMLGEVVVKGNASIYQMNSEGLVATVQGSALAKLGTLADVLNQLPFLNVQADAVQVLGRGAPLIYVNGRRLSHQKELAEIKASQVKQVQVILNPGSKYPSNVTSVVRITTIRTQGNGLSGMVQASAHVNKSFSHDEYLSLNYRKGGLDIFATMYYTDRKSWEEQSNNLTFTHNSKSYRTQMDGNQTWQRQHAVPSLGVNYVSPNNSLYTGIRYTYSRTIKTPFDQTASHSYFELGKEYHTISRYLHNSSGGMHNTDAYILKNFKNKWQLEGDITFTRLSLATDLSTTETEGATTTRVSSHTNKRSAMVAEKLTLTKGSAIGKFTFGEEYTYTDNKQHFVPHTDASITHLRPSNNQAQQHAVALFAEYGRAWKHVSLNAGIRYEGVSFDYRLNGTKQTEQSKWHNSLTPTLSLNYTLGKFGATLSFRPTISRPSYQQMRGSMAYNNRYQYEGGNPALLSDHQYDFGLLLRYADLVASVNYIHHSNAVMFCHRLLDDVPVSISSFANAAYQSTKFMLAYTPTFGIWKPTFSVKANLQQLTHNGQSYNAPILVYAFKNLFSFPHSLSFTLNLAGNSAGNDEFLYYRTDFTASAALTKQLPCGLSFTLGMQDILHTKRERWTMNNNGVASDKWLSPDSRQAYLTIRYDFKPVKSKYRGTGAGASEKGRL